MIPILLIEDQVELCQILKDTLGLYGFDVTYAHNGDDGYNLFTTLDPKLVIIDIMMPGSDGFAAVKQVRAVNKDVPIIMLTAKPLTEDLVKAFDLGCNDFIRKPFVMEELIARIRSLARVSGNVSHTAQNVYKLGSFTFNTSTHELVNHSNRFQLSYKEVELLKRLCEAKSTVVDRQLLLAELWGSDNVFNSKTMNVYINRLRNYLDADKCVEILTIRGFGYKLIERSS
ncbi:response regulator transcription factor [Aridibaculum aurantiacum]|uniref:response regulator transcription factor n=1 Tax=Aridibaculum aurantiacum TaxID=2810307 RepID=UPI001A960568|nr:response regulator transcription factor [Aridibaculum aurantiacum]